MLFFVADILLEVAYFKMHALQCYDVIDDLIHKFWIDELMIFLVNVFTFLNFLVRAELDLFQNKADWISLYLFVVLINLTVTLLGPSCQWILKMRCRAESVAIALQASQECYQHRLLYCVVRFYRATVKHTHSLAIDICLSVRLSNACIVTKQNNCLSIFQRHTTQQCF